MRFPIALVAVLLAATPALAADPAPTADATLTVTFAGIETTKGNVMLALYDADAAWNAGKPVRGTMVAATGAEVAASFPDLAPGHYAIKAFHDVDGDGKMSTNPFGMPTEPFAFSNDAHGEHGPASWSDAEFTVVAGANVQRITIR